jgi:hypothetical protein
MPTVADHRFSSQHLVSDQDTKCNCAAAVDQADVGNGIIAIELSVRIDPAVL